MTRQDERDRPHTGSSSANARFPLIVSGKPAFPNMNAVGRSLSKTPNVRSFCDGAQATLPLCLGCVFACVPTQLIFSPVHGVCSIAPTARPCSEEGLRTQPCWGVHASPSALTAAQNGEGMATLYPSGHSGNLPLISTTNSGTMSFHRSPDGAP